MAAYKKTSFLLLILLAFILFESPLLANNNDADCFPFKEEWGLSTEELKKAYKQHTNMVEMDEIIDNGGEINLYGEKSYLSYIFEDNALSKITYSSLQSPETGLILFKKYEKNLKCLFGKPSEGINVKKYGINIYLTFWEKDKTTIYLAFAEISPIVVLAFYDNNNPINKENIEEHKSFIKRMKEYKEKEKN